MATSVRLAAHVEQRLDHLAAATGRTKFSYLLCAKLSSMAWRT